MGFPQEIILNFPSPRSIVSAIHRKFPTLHINLSTLAVRDCRKFFYTDVDPRRCSCSVAPPRAATRGPFNLFLADDIDFSMVEIIAATHSCTLVPSWYGSDDFVRVDRNAWCRELELRFKLSRALVKLRHSGWKTLPPLARMAFTRFPPNMLNKFPARFPSSPEAV